MKDYGALLPEEKRAVEVLSTVGSGMRQAILQEGVGRKAREKIDEAFSDLYKSAAEYLPRQVGDLEDPKKYVAALLTYMQLEPKTRSKKDMLIHIGKVFGHDKRTINIEDKRTYSDVLRQLQAEFAPVVTGTATVKQVDAGR